MGSNHLRKRGAYCQLIYSAYSKQLCFIPCPLILSCHTEFYWKGLGTSYSRSLWTRILVDSYAKGKQLLRFYQHVNDPRALGTSATEACGCNNDQSLNSMAPTVPTSPHCLLPSQPVPAQLSGRVEPLSLSTPKCRELLTHSCSLTHRVSTSRTHMSLGQLELLNGSDNLNLCFTQSLPITQPQGILLFPCILISMKLLVLPCYTKAISSIRKGGWVWGKTWKSAQRMNLHIGKSQNQVNVISGVESEDGCHAWGCGKLVTGRSMKALLECLQLSCFTGSIQFVKIHQAAQLGWIHNNNR